MPSTLPPLVRFTNFEVNFRAGELRRVGRKVRLQEQPSSDLTVLLESAGKVVTREELRERLWAEDAIVDFDHRLAVALTKLRDALRDSAEKFSLIEAVGCHCDRLVGQLEPADSLSENSVEHVTLLCLPFSRAELPSCKSALGASSGRNIAISLILASMPGKG